LLAELANQEHLNILAKGIEVCNAWRSRSGNTGVEKWEVAEMGGYEKCDRCGEEVYIPANIDHYDYVTIWSNHSCHGPQTAQSVKPTERVELKSRPAVALAWPMRMLRRR
jgi:hypothetical protein